MSEALPSLRFPKLAYKGLFAVGFGSALCALVFISYTDVTLGRLGAVSKSGPKCSGPFSSKPFERISRVRALRLHRSSDMRNGLILCKMENHALCRTSKCLKTTNLELQVKYRDIFYENAEKQEEAGFMSHEAEYSLLIGQSFNQ